MTTELDVLHDISLRLNEASIPFMLTGSVAMVYYAEPRMTRDIDLVIHMQRKDIPALIGKLGEDYLFSQEVIFDAVTRLSIFNLVHVPSLIKVDCILRKGSVFRALEFERRREIKILDFFTSIVSKEDLILSKLEWSRESHSELQMRDIRNLMATGFDKEYLHKWISELKLESIFKLAEEETRKI